MHPQPKTAPPLPGGQAEIHAAQLEILALFERPAWHAQAACYGAGFDTFFPARGQSTTKARSYCEGCPVTAECLDSALQFRDHGVWAGTSGRERRKIRRLPKRRDQQDEPFEQESA